MEVNSTRNTRKLRLSAVKAHLSESLSGIPILGWLSGALVSVLLERMVGTPIAHLVGLERIPVLFGVLIMLKEPLMIPGALAYVFAVYLLPAVVLAYVVAGPANVLAEKLVRVSSGFSVLLHLALLYAILHIWAEVSDYRLITLKLTLIAVMLTLSLNVINGYMGEFSCSHPGFMALGAYSASVISLIFFVGFRSHGPMLPTWLAPLGFPLALILGGLVSSLGAIAVAVPSFRTRGDYLAIISLAFLFIVKSLIENLELVGGPRGLSKQPDWASLPVVFFWTALCLWMINNFVRSILGKAMNAVRDDELAANAMTIDTRRTKVTAFLFAAFWAGVAGGLFAHVVRYVNPSMFGVQNLAEGLAMVYFGGLNSVYGSIVGAVSISLLGEALRPLEIFKWIIIPLLLILVMIYRPTGLVAFKELDVLHLIRPKAKRGREGGPNASR
ncbi:MAG: branched-chain amino acid ABC transporter permease [Deltaproteobacteria bacterium HGW-Deltaproteobacteria-15]|jgi:branched-chain amino acid transport system permease protein|nr:MAG: branched-chain amino acid ABC transporter permease [Deltaproteobacteria bacterium HGW-Deltaproteobacteria-15]